jgi:hypothetical protein
MPTARKSNKPATKKIAPKLKKGTVPKPLSASLILCEKILNEADRVLSAIRIADLFYIHSVPDVSPENQAVMVNILVMCKFPTDDNSTHVVTLRLARPDGTEKDVDFGQPLEFSLASIVPVPPGSPRGFNVIGPWGVKATHMGLHRLRLLVDGEEVAHVVFTLARQPVQTT